MKNWHSKKAGTAVYHNNPKCTLGNNIETKNRAPGKGGKRLCSQCRTLNKKKR